MTARKRSTRTKKEFDWTGFVLGLSRWLLKICGVIFFLALGYTLYGIFSGAARQLEGEAVTRVANNWRLMGQVMTFTGFFGTLALCVLTFGEIAFAVVAGIIGAGLMFGMPMLIASNIADPSANHAIVLNIWSKNAGMAILTVVGLRIAWAIVDQVIYATTRGAKAAEDQVQPTKTKEKKKRRSGLLWQACWDMPYCHEAVREICPAYKARKTCWRFGYGCNCDPSLIEQLIRTGGANVGKGVSGDKVTRQQQFVRSDLQADVSAGTRERTISCRECAIFIEHQRQKFGVLNPVFIVATIVGLVFLYKPFVKVYSSAMESLAQVAVRLTYGEMVSPEQWVMELNTPTVRIFIYIILATFAMAYVLKFVEWAILKKMIL